MLRKEQRARQFDALLAIARDLTASLAVEDRHERLLEAVRRILPCDAACLLRLEGDDLVPLAGHGLSAEALAQRYSRREHPRLDVILRSSEPVRFPPDSPLADPFDGLLQADPHALHHIHACLGCALRDGEQVVGALTADAIDRDAFDELDSRILAALGALAGAALRTSMLIEALEKRVERKDALAAALQRSAAELSGGRIVGRSAAVRRLLDEVDVVAGSDMPVLITGETGVGKELVARRIHDASPRCEAALIHLNCAALPEAIAESELFGHKAGAFTGATKDRAGKFEIADGGTLFLDEIGELPLNLQPKLLRALQDGEIQRIGSDRVHRTDVRVIAATNRDLDREVESGRFRADLYHRLAVYPVRVPPLRERRDDIPLLAAHFLAICRRRLGLGPLRLTEAARVQLCDAEWPGNVRELENVISRAVLRAAAGDTSRSALLIEPGHLGLPTATRRTSLTSAASTERAVQADRRTLRERTDDYQRAEILAALEAAGGNQAAAARALGLHRSNFHRIVRRLGIDSKQ